MSIDRREIKINESTRTRRFQPHFFVSGRTAARFRFKNSPRSRLFILFALIGIGVVMRIIRYNLFAYRALQERHQLLRNSSSIISSIQESVNTKKILSEPNLSTKSTVHIDENPSNSETAISDTFERDKVVNTLSAKEQSNSERLDALGGQSELETYHDQQGSTPKSEKIQTEEELSSSYDEKMNQNIEQENETKTLQDFRETKKSTLDEMNSENWSKKLESEERMNQLQKNVGKAYGSANQSEISENSKSNLGTDIKNRQSEDEILGKNYEYIEPLKSTSSNTLSSKSIEGDYLEKSTSQAENFLKSNEKVQHISEYLNFTQKTSLNFMHFHKTGGVSFKTALFKFFLKKFKKNGEPVRVRDACYRRNISVREGAPTFDIWRCDWMPLWELGEVERNKYDVIFGHQYRVGGAEKVLNWRDVRTFSVLRHPFDRKVSFFFHFFIRERGRKESEVQFEEVREFLLFDRLRDPSFELGKDLGPNYMAGRIMSDGKHGYIGNSRHKYYKVPTSLENNLAENSLKIIRQYIFVGLQTESAASMCMLRKTIENFNLVNGISNEGTERLAATARVLNTGSYLMKSTEIWSRLTLEEKNIFRKKEKVDITIYEEAEQLFRRQVKLFQCESFLKSNKAR